MSNENGVLVERLDNLDLRVDKIETRIDKAEIEINTNTVNVAVVCSRMDASIKALEGLTRSLQWGFGITLTIVLGLLGMYLK